MTRLRGTRKTIHQHGGALWCAWVVVLCVAAIPGPAPAQSTTACATGVGIECRAITATLQYLRTARHVSSDTALGVQAAHVLGLLRTACWHDYGDACYIAGRLRMAWGASSPESLLPALDSAASLFRHGCTRPTRPSAAACNELAELLYYRAGGASERDSAMVYYARGCTLGNSTACFRWGARLGQGEYPELGGRGGASWVGAVAAACAAGSTGGCVAEQYNLDTLLVHAPDSLLSSVAYKRMAQRSVMLARASCAHGNSIACSNLGLMFDAEPYAVAQNRDSAIFYYRLACAGQTIRASAAYRTTNVVHVLGYGPACRSLGQELIASIAGPAAADSADSAYARGCDITYLYMDPCGSLALLRFQRASGRPDAQRAAYVLAMAACMGANGVACGYAGWMLLPQQLDDPAQALAYLHRGCALRDAWSCYLAGFREPTATDSVKSFRQGCDLQEPAACLQLARLVRQRFGFTPQADTIELQACNLNSATACWDVMLRYHAINGTDAEMREGMYRAKACWLDRLYCKKSISS